LLHALAPGDVVTVTRIDRLARSTFDLFGIVKRIVDAKAQCRSLAEPLADTGTSTGRLDARDIGWPGRRGARSYPHPHGGR
jgi:DNA invertase Pin-like site-specific DNA recombinase